MTRYFLASAARPLRRGRPPHAARQVFGRATADSHGASRRKRLRRAQAVFYDRTEYGTFVSCTVYAGKSDDHNPTFVLHVDEAYGGEERVLAATRLLAGHRRCGGATRRASPKRPPHSGAAPAAAYTLVCKSHICI